MELYPNDILTIFKVNFSYNLEQTPLGLAVKMPCKEAFLFSAVTGAGYLDNPIYPFTPKGLLKLFYNAFHYNFVTGIFENLSLKHTPYILSKAKPFLFNTPYKWIVPIAFDSEIELQSVLENQFNQLNTPTDYLILRLEKSKKGHGLEPFMEYLVAEYFKQHGFIVENQIPLAYAIGTPDFAGYGLKETITCLNEFGLLPLGFHILELALLRIFREKYPILSSEHESLIVGEAKTSSQMMTKQLLKYLDTNLFDFGLEIHPSKQKPAQSYLGLFTLDHDFKIAFIPPQTTYQAKNNLSKNDYCHWLNNYMKFYLLANLTNDEFNDYFMQVKHHKITSQKDIVEFVNQLAMPEILARLMQLMR